LSYITG